MRGKIFVVFLLGVVVGVAGTAAVARLGSPGPGSGNSTPLDERDLTQDEVKKLTGLMGARDSGLCGDLYNGNTDLSVTEIELLVATYGQGDTTRRIYRHDAHDSPISPLTTTGYCVGILLNAGEDFSWKIASAKGHAAPSPNPSARRSRSSR